jgi:hypothetical protein
MSIATAGIASSTGSNLLIGPGGVAACIASGQPAALCNKVQNTFLAPAGASPLGAVDSLTGEIVDFQFLNGTVERDAGKGAPFYRVDVSLQKIFKLFKAERVSFELREMLSTSSTIQISKGLTATTHWLLCVFRSTPSLAHPSPTSSRAGRVCGPTARTWAPVGSSCILVTSSTAG